jgi:hypothetical protein
MLRAMLAVHNLFGGNDVWKVNTERSHHEEISVLHSVFSSDEAGVVV